MPQNPAPIRPRTTDARDYEAALRRAYLRPFVERVLRRLAAATGTTYVWRALDAELGALQATPQAGVPIEMIEAHVRRVEGYHRQRLIQTFRAALGVDVRVFLTRPAVAAFMSELFDQNVSLIKTIPPRFHEGLRQRVGEEFAAAPFDQQRLRAMLRDEYQSAGYNLRRLTRDQTNKQVGNLSRLRHGQLGIERFIWRSVQDERVRSTHADFNGQTYEWARAPEGGPGAPIQCRCTAEPSLTQSDMQRLGARGTVTARTPKPKRTATEDTTPADARKRFAADFKRHAKDAGIPQARKDLLAAEKAHKSAIAQRDKDYAKKTSRQRLDDTSAVIDKRKALEAARGTLAEKRFDAERAVWRDTFGGRKPAAGMDTAIIGKPSADFRLNASAAADDFRRMVHPERLKRVGKVEIQSRKIGAYGDAGIAFTNPATGKERIGGFGAKSVYAKYPDSRRRIRVRPDEPGEAHLMTPDMQGGLDKWPKFRGSETIVHELGHHLEDANPAMLASAREFILKRGKKSKAWLNDYAGTIYKFQGSTTATEVVSVGMEQLYTHPVEFARRDPEFFDWIWKWVVRGKGD